LCCRFSDNLAGPETNQGMAMSRITTAGAVLAAMMLSTTVGAAAQPAAIAPLNLQRMTSAAQVNTDEARMARMEARLKRLDEENEALKARVADLEARSGRWITMPENCRAGTTTGLSMGIDPRFHSNAFPYLTCGR
jgi:hypothetical protein